MNFGNDPHPKWTEKEEMTSIFLSAMGMDSREVTGEINSLFGNDRSLSAVEQKLNKNGRAVSALLDLIVANRYMIVTLWQNHGVGLNDVRENDPVYVADPNGFREVPQAQGEVGWKETFYDKVRRLFPHINEDMSEEDLLNEVRKLRSSTELPLALTKVTTQSVEFKDDSDVTLPQLRGVLQALRGL